MGPYKSALFITYKNNSSKFSDKIIKFIEEYVNKEYFVVEDVIAYLENNSIIEKEIFTQFVQKTKKSIFGLTYLSNYVPTRKEKFIKRIPIYYYDVNIDEGSPSMTNFLHGYYKYYSRQDPIADFTNSEYIYENIDEGFFENLYDVLESLMYDCDIKLEDLLNYIAGQSGSEDNYFIFEYWMNYIKLIDYKNNRDFSKLFPRNLLYTYNLELENLGRSPELFVPYRKTGMIDGPDDIYYDIDEENKTVEINGFFPVDEENKPVFKWIGISAVNVEDIKYELASDNKQVEFMPAYIRRQLTAALKVTIKYKVNSNSRIFVAARENVGIDGFNSNYKFRERWYEIYVGHSLIELDISKIDLIRAQAGETLKTLSEKTGIDIRTIQRIMSEEVTPNGLNLLKIMSFLGIESWREIIKKQIIEDPKFKIYLTEQKVFEEKNKKEE